MPLGAAPRARSRAPEALFFAALALGGVGGVVWHLAPRWSALPEAASAGLAALGIALWLRQELAREGGRGGGAELASGSLLAGAALAVEPVPGADAAGHLLMALAGVQLLRFSGEREHRRAPRAIPGGADAFRPSEVLKRDLFGRIELGDVSTPVGPQRAVRRDFRAGALWLRPVAALLARREARALGWLADVERVPRLLDRGHGRFLRSYVEGRPLADAGPREPVYFADARRLLRRIHARGVTHNDTHKVHNWLVTPDGRPALVDFQIAGRHAARTRWFRLCALEDIRHLLKHKRTFCAEALTARERALLARRSWIARGWLATVKPVYVLVTRRLLHWRDREGRGRPPGPR